MTQQIGFIGLGNMGTPMALNVLRGGYTLRVYNRNPEKVKPLVHAGAREIMQPRDVTEHGGITITMVANDQALEEVTLGPNGFLEHLGPGGIHISMSTVSPKLADKMARLHEENGCSYIAAPVFGRPDAAAAKKLWIIEAGPEKAKKRVKPILETMGQSIFDFGTEPSSANVVKISGNFMMASAMETMGEVFALAEKNHIDRKQVIDMFSSTLFSCPIYENYGKNIAARNYEPVGFEMQLALKDIDLVLDTAENTQVPMPFASQLHDRLLNGIAKGRASHDWMELTRGINENAGIE